MGRLAGVLPVPVCGHGLVVPDCGGLRVADVARLSGVVGGIDEQRLHGEGLQVPRLKVRHELRAEENKGQMGEMERETKKRCVGHWKTFDVDYDSKY